MQVRFRVDEGSVDHLYHRVVGCRRCLVAGCSSRLISALVSVER